jgi:hypothetical protein
MLVASSETQRAQRKARTFTQRARRKSENTEKTAGMIILHFTHEIEKHF